jgi:hypothetical protein
VAIVCKRTILTKQPPLVGKVSANPLRVEGVAWSAQRIPTAVNLRFLDRSRYFFIQVAPQLSSWGWVEPVPDPLLLRKSGRAMNRTQDLWICSQKLWPLDHRGDSTVYSNCWSFSDCNWSPNVHVLLGSFEKGLKEMGRQGSCAQITTVRQGKEILEAKPKILNFLNS